MKKIIALTLLLMMFVGTVCFAAVSSSGGKSSSSPSSSGSMKSSTPSPSLTKPADNSGAYKPSAPANSFSDKAPTKPVAPPLAAQPQTSGGFWHSASMFGGGLLAGSLLGHMFGGGGYGYGGGESSIFGMLINLLMIGAIVMGIRFLWDKYKNRNM